MQIFEARPLLPRLVLAASWSRTRTSAAGRKEPPTPSGDEARTSRRWRPQAEPTNAPPVHSHCSLEKMRALSDG